MKNCDCDVEKQASEVAYNIFRYGGISIITILALAIIITGCGPMPRGTFSPAPPKPEIFIERGEAANGGAVVKITYKWHVIPTDRNPSYVVLNSLEEIQAYKKEVDFLASQLDEVEKRMQVHEQQSKDQSPVP